MSSSRARLAAGLILFGIASLVSALLGEGALRVAASTNAHLGYLMREWDPLAVKIEPHGEFGYRQKPGESFDYYNGTLAHANAAGWRGPLVAVPKPAGTFRVVLLGGSTSHGWAVNDDQTIDAYLRQILGARFPGRRIEVVNLGFDGYDAYQDFERMRSDGLRLQPDAVILNSGINDVRNARYPNLVDRDPRTLLWKDVMDRLRREQAQGGPSLWSRVKHWSFLARTPGLLRGLAAERQVQRVQASRVEITPNLQAADLFAMNLGRVVTLTDSSAPALLFSTPPSALRMRYGDFDTSARTYWVVDAETTQRLRDTLDARMQAVAGDARAKGREALYVPHPAMTPAMFLDDCHLTPEGNRQVAEDFAAALAPLVERGVATR